MSQGERRIRYDDRGRNLVTEVVNHLDDVSVVGLVFGRQGVEDVSPIRYADTDTVPNMQRQTVDNSTVNQSDTGILSEAEVGTGQYVLPSYTANQYINIDANRIHESNEGTERTHGENRGRTYDIQNSSMDKEYTVPDQSEKPESALPLSEIPDAAESQSESMNREQKDIYNENTNAENNVKTNVPKPEHNISQSVAAQKKSDVPEDTRSGSPTDGKKIWSPASAQADERNRERKQRRDERGSPAENWLYNGRGAHGRIYESTGYAATFGGLSSY